MELGFSKTEINPLLARGRDRLETSIPLGMRNALLFEAPTR